MKRALFSLVSALALACGSTFAAEVARIKFAANQDEFELSAVMTGTQTLTVSASGAQLLWADGSVTQKFLRGRHSLVIPVAAGESVVPGAPQAAPDGGTVFAFSRNSASASGAAPVQVVVASASPPPMAVPAPSSVSVAPDVTPAAIPEPVPSPPPSPVVTAPTPAPAESLASSVTVVRASAEVPAGAAAVAPANDSIRDAVEQFLPGKLAFDPVARADFSIPESPGAAVLDQTAQILRPAAPRETVTSLLSHFDGDGALKSGFSIAVTPYTLWRKEPVRLADYHTQPMTRFLTRLQVSLAAKTGSTQAAGVVTTSNSALFGLGLSGVLFDDSDPRRDETLLGMLDALFPTSWMATPEARRAFAQGRGIVVPPVEDRKLAAHAQIMAAARKARWNAAALGFGYALRLQSANGKIEDAKEDGGAVWLNYSRPGFGSLDENSQLLFTASYRYHDTFDRDGVTGVEDTFNLAAQYRVGTRDFNGFAQAVYHWRAPKTLRRFSETTLELGLEKKVMDGLWLNVGWSNDESLGGDSVLKTGLRYGFGQAAGIGDVK